MASKFSLLNVLEHNFKKAGRTSYVNRVIYIGDHVFTSEYPTIFEVFTENINQTSEKYSFEPLTGLFLYYSRYYVHMVEGSEEVILRHMKSLFTNSAYLSKFGRGKILVTYHNINQRFFDKWGARFATPPTLLSKIDPQADMEESSRYIKICMTKVYNLCKFLRQNSTEGSKGMGHITEKAADFLPEFALLDFLLNSRFLTEMNDYIGQYDHISEVVSYEQKIWPAPCDLIPHDVFDEPQEPIEDLYKEVNDDLF